MLSLVEKKTGMHLCVFAFDRAVTSECVEWVHCLTEAKSSSLKASETMDHVKVHGFLGFS